MDTSPQLGPIQTQRRSGREPFHDQGKASASTVSDFWQWACSDLVSNATRGVLAEYIVALALGVAEGVREEWAAHDLTTADGVKVEVKSAAYIQSWHQERLSSITFRVPKTRAWDPETNCHSTVVCRQADVYVFALLAHTNQDTLDPLDLSQWEFFVVPTAHLNARSRGQHSITLPSLRALSGPAVQFGGLKAAVQEAGELHTRQVNNTRSDSGPPA